METIADDAIREIRLDQLNLDACNRVKRIFYDEFKRKNQEVQQKSIENKTEISYGFIDKLIKKLKKQKSELVRKRIRNKKEHEARNARFKDQFEKLRECFDKQIEYLYKTDELDLLPSLTAISSDLSEPIHLFTKSLYPVEEVTTQYQHIASLILKIVIHLTMKSPILIIDSLDYSVHRDAISILTKYLCKLHCEAKFQVIFMFVKPPEQMDDVSSVHLMWDESAVCIAGHYY